MNNAVLSRLFHVLLVLAILPNMSACGQEEKTSASYVEQAQGYIDAHNYQAAVISLKNALVKDPDNLEARWLLGQAAIELGNGPVAEKEITRALSLGLSEQAAQPLLIEAIFLQGDYARVIEETAVLADGLPGTDKAMLLGLRGQAYLELRDFDQAEQVLDSALEIDRNAMTALVGKGRMSALKADLAESRRWTKLALEADNSAPEPWIQLGEIEWSEGNLEEAEAAFSEAIKLTQSPTLVFTRRALVRIYREDFKGAEEDLGVLKRAGLANDPTVKYVEGISFFNQEKYQQAAEAFEATLRIRPKDLPAKMYLASTYLVQGKIEQAQVLAEQVNVQLPNNPAAKNLLGTTQARQSDYEAARTTLEASLRQSPDNSETLGMLGTLALLEGDATSGVEYFQKVVEQDPDSQYARQRLMTAKLLAGEDLETSPSELVAPGSYESEFVMAVAAFQQQNFSLALQRAQKLHEQHPDRVDPLNLMAACHLALTDGQKAREVLGQVLDLEPANPSANKNLARMEVIEGELEKAESLLHRVISVHPGDREAVLLMVDLKTRQGDLSGAMQVLESGLEQIPGDALMLAMLVERNYQAGRVDEVLSLTRELKDSQITVQPALIEYRGRVQYMLGDNRGAQRSFKRWKAARPESPEARLWLANALAGAGDLKRASAELNSAVRLDESFLPARLARVKVQAQQGESKEAEKELDVIKQEFGETSQVLAVAGWLALQQQDYARAENLFARASAEAQDTELTLLWAKALGAQGKTDQAFKVMDDWLDGHPRDISVLLTVAGLYLGMDRTEDARIGYEKVVDIVPWHVVSLNNLAWLNQDTDLNQAIDYAERAYKQLPRDPQIQDTLGYLLLKRGDYERSGELLREAATAASDNPQIQLHYAEVLLQQKKYAEAERQLDGLEKEQADAAVAAEVERLKKLLPSP